MRHSPSEKLEIIRIVEDSELSVRRTLKEMGIHRSTFYNWYRRYLDDGVEGLGPKKPKARTFWNKRFLKKSKSRSFARLWGKPNFHPENWPAGLLIPKSTSSRNPVFTGFLKAMI